MSSEIQNWHAGSQAAKMTMNRTEVIMFIVFIVFLSHFFHFCPYSLVLHGKEQRHLAKFLLWCFMSLEKANGDRIFT